MELKEGISKQCLMELNKTQIIGESPDHEDAEYELQASRFKVLFDLIESLGFAEEYEEWRQTNKTSIEEEG